MSTDAYWSWDAAERRCYEYINGVLGTLEGVQGYMPEDYPRTATLVSQCNNWTFEMSGGDSPHIRAPSERGNTDSMWMLAEFRGRFTERTLAKRVACALWSALPAGANDAAVLAGISQIQPSAYPSCEADVVDVANDLEEGGETRVWNVSIPCWVVFGYLDQYT